MDRVRDLTATDGRADELLTNTSGGLFDAQYLSGDPPTAYLADYEQPQYVLRNKKAGLEVTQAPDVDSTTPDGDHQALAVVTDCRLLFLVGRAGGDESVSVRHDDVVEATAESSGFLTSALVVEVVGGERYRFPCRGDVSPVADYVEDAAQTWANASRLTDEASDQLAASREALDDGEFDQARAVLDDVAAKVTTAQERVSAVGDGASEALEERASRLFETLRKLEQEIAAMKGAHHHAAGQEAWKTDHDFEQAAREYDRAVEEYERALAAEGTTPSDESVQLRLKGLVKERELLRAAPMADAKAAREVAMATDDPDEAATEWETALTCYREAVTLDWGESNREFVVDRERAKERAVEATDQALDAHLEAGDEWVVAGDKIVGNGRRQQARQAYKRAERHFQTAHDIARELRPERVDDIEERLDDLQRRQTGEVVPEAATEASTLSVDAVADQLATDESSRATDDGLHGDGPHGGVGDAAVDTEDGAETAMESQQTTDPTPAIRRVESSSSAQVTTPADPRSAI